MPFERKSRPATRFSRCALRDWHGESARRMSQTFTTPSDVPHATWWPSFGHHTGAVHAAHELPDSFHSSVSAAQSDCAWMTRVSYLQ